MDQPQTDLKIYSFLCKFCSESFPNKLKKDEHEMKLHSNEEIYFCDYCGKRFNDNQRFISHQESKCSRIKKKRLLNNLKQKLVKHYQCQVCSKVFTNNANYVRHFVGQHSQKRFDCKECGYRYVYRDSLMRHNNLSEKHTREKIYPCPLCDQTFTNSRCLAAHQEIWHRVVKKKVGKLMKELEVSTSDPEDCINSDSSPSMTSPKVMGNKPYQEVKPMLRKPETPSKKTTMEASSSSSSYPTRSGAKHTETMSRKPEVSIKKPLTETSSSSSYPTRSGVKSTETMARKSEVPSSSSYPTRSGVKPTETMSRKSEVSVKKPSMGASSSSSYPTRSGVKPNETMLHKPEISIKKPPTEASSSSYPTRSGVKHPETKVFQYPDVRKKPAILNSMESTSKSKKNTAKKSMNVSKLELIQKSNLPRRQNPTIEATKSHNIPKITMNKARKSMSFPKPTNINQFSGKELIDSIVEAQLTRFNVASRPTARKSVTANGKTRVTANVTTRVTNTRTIKPEDAPSFFDDGTDSIYYRDDSILCTDCDLKFESQDNLAVHREQKHGIKIGLVTTVTQDFHENIDDNIDRKPLICNECGLAFIIEASLIIHQQEVHSDRKTDCEAQDDVDTKPPICTECNLHFSSQKLYLQHKCNKHSELKFNTSNGYSTKEFLCMECGMDFVLEKSLIMHLQVKHRGDDSNLNPVDENCNVEELPSTSRDGATSDKDTDETTNTFLQTDLYTAVKHSLRHKRKAISYQDTIVDDLVEYDDFAFEERNQKKPRNSNVKKFVHEYDKIPDVSTISDSCFVPLLKLSPQEIYYHTGLQQFEGNSLGGLVNFDYGVSAFQILKNLNIDPDSIEYLKCDICELEFANYLLRKDHNQKFHNFSTVQCVTCLKTFKGRPTLTTHYVAQHIGQNIYRCKYCDRTFNYRASLRAHTYIHTSGKSFVCHLCGHAFTLRWQLTSHIRDHKPLKPICCQRCNKRFVNITSLKRHQKKWCQVMVQSKTMSGAEPIFVSESYVHNFPDNPTTANLILNPDSNSNQNDFEQGLQVNVDHVENVETVQTVKTHNSSRMSCRYCFKEFSSLKNARRHEKYWCSIFRQSQPETNFQQNVSNADFSDNLTNTSFTEEQNVNEATENEPTEDIPKPIDPFRCQYCDKRFSSVKNVKRHEKNCCSVFRLAQATTVEEQNFTVNASNQEPIKEFNPLFNEAKDTCQKNIKTVLNFDQIDETKPDIVQNEGISTPKLNKLHCRYCDKRFSSERSVIRHEKDWCPVVRQAQFNSLNQEDIVTDNTSIIQQEPTTEIENQKSEVIPAPKRIERCCRYCNKHFASGKTLKNHEKYWCPVIRQPSNSGMDIDQTGCRNCNKHFAYVKTLKKHEKFCCPTNSSKMENTQNDCQHCNKRFASLKSLKRHENNWCPVVHAALVVQQDLDMKHTPIEQSTSMANYTTEYLRNNNTRNANELTEIDNSTGKSFKCQKCNKRFFSRWKYSSHIKTHKNLKPVTCHHCFRVYSDAGYFKRHLKCSWACRKFAKSSTNIPNQSNTKDLQITDFVPNDHVENPTDFENGSSNSIRVTINLNNIEQKSKMNLQHKTKKCYVVIEKFSDVKIRKLTARKPNNTNLGLGNLTSEDIGPSSLQILNKLGIEAEEKGPDLICLVCQLMFNTLTEKKVHLKSHKLAHMCKVCRNFFSSSTNLNRHYVGQHLGVNVFACEYCDKTFNYRDNLTKHRDEQHNQTKFTCRFCPAFFNYKWTLERHEIFHTGVKQHSCRFCKKSFSMQHRLKQHLVVCRNRKKSLKEKFA